MGDKKLSQLTDAGTLSLADLVYVSRAVGSPVSVQGDYSTTIGDIIALCAGKQTVWIPAGAMLPRISNGPAVSSEETTTNKVMRSTLNFDSSVSEYAQFSIAMPESWDEGTVTFKPVWSHGALTGSPTEANVVWELQAVALSDGDAQDAAFGTMQSSSDTGGTTDALYTGPESSAITIAGTPAARDTVVFQIYRNPSSASDNMALDARLHGVILHYTVTGPFDA